LLETDQAKAMVEGAQERGYLEPAELEAFALELDLDETEVEELTTELERIGLEIRRRGRERSAAEAAAAASGAADSLSSSSPTSAAADRGRRSHAREGDQRGDATAKRRMIESNLRLVVYCEGLSS
jgi:DNA-directed RNA polymerase sigma subunit (sigma70/sigma32)